ncbi:alpha/beta hydrolase [Pseudooceanicola sp.]|uniref:alpha/beta hydrolase n=1 Tax=Pseudooceanicola sp. TaxID=1914328 RepID=UPI0035C6A468
MTDRLDPSAQAVLEAMQEADLPPLEGMSAKDARQAFRERRGRRRPELPEIAGVEDRLMALDGRDLAIRIYRPLGPGPHPVIVYFHGGGWVVGDLDTHDTLCRLLCAASGMGVVAVDYRLAPDAPFPTAAEDAVAATEWVAREAAELGFDPGWIGVAGDSAGGNLSAVAALALRGGSVTLRAQGLIYPAVDMTLEHPSHRAAKTDIVLTHAVMRWFRDHYVPRSESWRDWRASPLHADDHVGLPPAFVLTAGFDSLSDEGLAYAVRLRDAGVSVVERPWPGQFHGFLSMIGLIPEAYVATEELGHWFRDLAARGR